MQFSTPAKYHRRHLVYEATVMKFSTPAKYHRRPLVYRATVDVPCSMHRICHMYICVSNFGSKQTALNMYVYSCMHRINDMYVCVSNNLTTLNICVYSCMHSTYHMYVYVSNFGSSWISLSIYICGMCP